MTSDNISQIMLLNTLTLLDRAFNDMKCHLSFMFNFHKITVLSEFFTINCNLNFVPANKQKGMFQQYFQSTPPQAKTYCIAFVCQQFASCLQDCEIWGWNHNTLKELSCFNCFQRSSQDDVVTKKPKIFQKFRG